MEAASFSTPGRGWVGWGFWMRWMAVTTVGVSATSYAFMYASDVWNRAVDLTPRMDGLVGFSLLLAALGAGVGVMQWLLLRRQLSRAGWWVMAGMAGGVVVGVGLAADWAYDVVMGDKRFSVARPEPAIAATAALAAIGPMQWLVLRRQVSRAGWWVLANAVGLGGGYALGASIAVTLAGVLCDFGLFDCPGLGGTLGSIIYAFPPGFGLAFGAITGATMVWLLRGRTRHRLRLRVPASASWLRLKPSVLWHQASVRSRWPS